MKPIYTAMIAIMSINFVVWTIACFIASHFDFSPIWATLFGGCVAVFQGFLFRRV